MPTDRRRHDDCSGVMGIDTAGRHYGAGPEIEEERTMCTHSKRAAAILLIALGFASARAEGDPAAASADTDDFGMRGWGPRVGLAADPDQVVGGVHFDLGEFVPRVAFQPDVVLGLGDDVTAVVASAPVWYRFEGVSARVTPYAGGALAVGLFNVDRRDDDDTDVEFGFQVGGGGEWLLKGGTRFHVELRLDLGDVWDAVAVAGWTF